MAWLGLATTLDIVIEMYLLTRKLGIQDISAWMAIHTHITLARDEAS